MLPMYISRGSSLSSMSSDSEPTSPELPSPTKSSSNLSSCPSNVSTLSGSTTSLSTMMNQQQHYRRRLQLPVLGSSTTLSDSGIPGSSSSSLSAPFSSTSTSNTNFSKKRSLFDILLDRAALLFPSILILSFVLLLILNLLTPDSINLFTTSTTAYSSNSRSSFFSSSSFANIFSSRQSTKRKSHEELISELQKWKDPSYSRQRLRVYYYDLPSSFNSKLVENSHLNPPKIRDPHCDENFYSAENTIAEFFKNSAVRTTNASEADFFYVPIYTTCFLLTNQPNDVNRTGNFFKQAMNHVIQDYPYWNASDGRDHVMMFAQGFGARLSGDWREYRHATFLVHNGDYAEEHFDTHKDIVVPPDLRHYLSPVGMTDPDHLLTKKNFVLFGGQVVNASVTDHRGSNYSGGVRQYVQQHLSGVDGYKVTGVRSTTYIQDLKESVFCLAPHGWHKWSPRPAYAILLGCVPVVISEQQNLFLENLIDYEKVSYWIRPEEIMHMDEKLRSVSAKELADKERNLREIWRLFWYQEEGLAKEAIMYSLYRKLGGRSARPERFYI